MSEGNYYVTTPIYYVNDNPHIGHVYTTVAADVIARYKRAGGMDAFFLTGTDEHGQKIQRAARKQGLEPKQLADRVVDRYHDLWKRLNITHDDFIRTTEERHEETVLAVYERMKKNGDIYLGKYEGWYCTGCESFYPENQIDEGKCPEEGHPVEKLSEESYFFKLSAYQDRLLDFYEKNPVFIRPETRRNEVISFVKGGLQDLSISRTTFEWGVPVPEAEGHIFYVWLDALTNYISGIEYSGDGVMFNKYWPADVHLIGKDILRFHAVYWPAFLMSAGIEPPKTVFAHGWWLKEKGKMSKSKGNIINPDYLIEDFGADALRYFLMREMVFGQDAGFSDEAFINRVNSDLANDLGNLLNRVLTLVEKNLGGKFKSSAADERLGREYEKTVSDYRRHFDEFAFHEGLRDVWAFLGAINKYLDEKEPWKPAKDPDGQERVAETLYSAAEGLRAAAVLTYPVMPEFSQEIYSQLGLDTGVYELRFEEHAKWGLLPAGTKCRKGKPLFQRVDMDKYLREEKQVTEDKEKERSDLISIDEFAGVKLCVAEVVKAEAIPGAKKLLKIEVDLGSGTRTVVAGIAEVYRPEDLPGMRVIVVENLEPATLFGVESRGMVLAAVDDKGNPSIVNAPDNVPLGAVVR